MLTFALLALALASSEAGAARVVRTAGGAPVRWLSREIRLRPALPPPRAGVSASVMHGALVDAAAAWNVALRACGAPSIVVLDFAERPLPVAQDGLNAVVLRAPRWCPDSAVDDTDCYASWREATTHLRPASPGVAGEADVEVNAANYHWERASLTRLFTHELGHVLGLEHSSAGAMAPDPLRAPSVAPSADEVAALCALYPRPWWRFW